MIRHLLLRPPIDRSSSDRGTLSKRRRYPRRHGLSLLWITIVTTCLTLLGGSPADAQQGSDTATSVTLAPSGTQRFARGGWSTLSIVGVNRSEVDVEETVSVFAGENPRLQFSRRFWIPARSKRQTSLSFLVPPEIPLGESHIDVSMMQLNESEAGESFTDNVLGMPISKRSLMLSDSEINTGLMLNRPLPDGSSLYEYETADVRRMVNAGRDAVVNAFLDLGLVNFASNFLPATPHALDQLDQMVIGSDDLLSDTGGIAELRRWIHDGGRIWIMLDLTSEELVRELLGDDAEFTIVDRVELNDFQIDTAATVMENAAQESWSSETPVEMVRVFVESDEVSSRIDGWPAAFWQRVGHGEVLFTTLGANGWTVNQKPTTALHGISSRFFNARERPPRHSQAMIPILDDQIGYKIPSRRVAGLVLGINAVLILAAGIWWARRRRLERLAFLIPVSALTATAILLVIGSRQTMSIPSTVSTGQIIRVVDAVNEARVSTVRAIYSQQAGDLGLVSDYGTLTKPVTSEASGEIRRIRWDDSGKSQWMGSQQPPGVVRYVSSESTLPLAQRIVARGTFDGDGFFGTIEGLGSKSCEDGLIVAAAAPPTAVTWSDAQGSARGFQGGRGNVLAPRQYMADAILSETQRMRQDVLRKILAEPESSPFGSEPSLLLWTEPLDLRVRFDERFDHRGSALVSIPIQIDRPKLGADFQIPATFVYIDAYAGTQGATSVFNPRNGRWLKPMSNPIDAELLCRFPQSLLPMTLKSATVKIKINAPSRSLRVKAMVDGQPTEVFRSANPSGITRFTIDRSEALRLNQEGGLWLAIEVTETEAQKEAALRLAAGDMNKPDQASLNSAYQIDYVQVDTVAVASKRENSVNVDLAKQAHRD